MKKWFSVILLMLSALCWPDTIPISPSGPVFPIGISLLDQNGGPTGILNTWNFAPLYPNETVCLWIRNNAPGNVTYSVSSSGILDSAQTHSQPDAVSTLQATKSAANTTNTGTNVILVNGIASSEWGVQQVNASGLSSVNVTVVSDNGGATRTTDLILVQINGQAPCSSFFNLPSSSASLAASAGTSGTSQAGNTLGPALVDGYTNSPAMPSQLDPQGNVSNQLLLVYPYIFNGSTWDKYRSAPGTTGVPGVNTEGTKATYRAATNWSPVATSATDIFTITGTATKTVRVTHIGISCTATAAVASDILFLTRSTADTGGTSAAVIAVPLDSNDAAATATVLRYTANPTVGTLVGNISDDKAAITTATGAPQFYFEDFTIRNSKGLVLRAITQVLAINLNSASLAGIACAAEVEWTEE